MQAGCQCSAITFTTPTSSPLAIYICHCTECQHQSSSAFGISAKWPAFDIPEPHPGAISVYSRQTLKGHTLNCYFCAKCGSRLLHGSNTKDTVSVKGGCLAGKLDLSKAIHIWCKEAVVPVPAGAQRWEEEPGDLSKID